MAARATNLRYSSSMSNLPPPPGGEKPKITTGRIAIWVIVAGIGLYLIITGVVGIIAKG